MKKTPGISLIVLLMIFISGALFNLNAESKKKDKPAAKDSMRYYYDNKAVFEKLSGAAQSALIRAYGPKKGVGTLGTPKENPKGKLNPTAPNAVIVNVPVNNPALDLTAQNTQSETSIVLADGNIVVGYNDSGECTNLCAADEHFTGFSYSTNGGTSFVDGGALPDDPVANFGDVGDPVLGYDVTNDIVHFSALGMNFPTGAGPSLKCFRSTDGGITWSTRVDCTPGFAATDFQDKQWIAVDNFAGAGQGNVYQVWRQFSGANPQGIRFVRSTDGGLTWGPSPGTLIANQGSFNVQGAFVAVGPDHAVYVFWLDQSAGSGTAHILKGRKSTDQGVTWSAAANMYTFTNTLTNGNLNLTGGFRSNCFPHAVVIPAGTNANTIVLTFNDNDSVNGDPDIYSVECDAGDITTCAGKVQVNTESVNNQQFMPTLATTPDGGATFFTWYDRKNDPANMLIERFGRIFSGGGSTVDFVMSDNPFLPVFGSDPVVNSTYMGDYDHAVADNAFFYASFLDTEEGSQDVVFAKVPRAGPGTILSRGAVTIDDSGGNNNGTVEFNECLTMNVALNNFGTSTATGVNATLSTTTPGVTVTNAVSAYPNIAIGGTQTNSTPFQFETSPSFACGTPIEFTLNVTTSSSDPSGGASFSFTFTIPTGLGTPVPFDNNTVTPLVDAGTVNIPFNVSGFTGAIGKVTFSFHTTHTWDGDLDITLIAPDGTEVDLTTDNGGSLNNFGSNCSSRTVFDDAAAASITAASPPYVGTFRPEEALTGFDGLSGTDVNGTWMLRITDDTSVDTGSFQCGSLFLTPLTCTDGGGACGGGGCADPPVITTTTLPDGTDGVAYSQTVQATDGTPPYTWSISAGTLPTGLTLNTSTGEISGTPTATGTFNFTVMVTDTVAGCEDTQALSITIDPAAACTYEELFSDGTLTYLELNPEVTEANDFLNLDPTKKKAYATSGTDFTAQQNGTITAEVQFASGGELKSKAFMFTNWVSKKLNVEISLNPQRGKVIAKQRSTFVLAKERADFTFAFDTVYTVAVNYDGTDVEVSIDGTPVLTLTPVGTIQSGIIGFASRGMTTMVDRVCATP